MTSILWDDSPQGSDGWMSARAGAITGSRVRDALDRLKNGSMSDKAISYAYDLARQRVGGTIPPVFQNAYMREGTTQEPIARIQYELRSGNIVEEVGFACTHDGKFGCSPDGLIDEDGLWECKTMVSSKTLFTALADGDIGEYRHQCVFGMWLLSRKWCDLSLWCADLGILKTVRIDRDEAEIEAMVESLVAFDRFVSQLTDKLRATLAEHGIQAADDGPPAPEPEPEPEPEPAAPGAPAPAHETASVPSAAASAEESIPAQASEAQVLAQAPAVATPQGTAGMSPLPAAAGTPAPTPVAADAPPMKLGAVNERLGITMTEAFVRDTLRIPVARDGRAVLIAAADWPRLKVALIRHVEAA